MANGFADALGKFGRGFALGMAPADMRASVLAERERERQMEAMNPIRGAVLSELLGPRNTFEGAPSSPPGGFMGQVDTGTAEGQATPQALPVEPQVRALPPELTPPPEIDAVLHDAAARFGVPVNALRAIAAQESSFNPAAVNKPTAGDPTDPGAVGLFQFIDETARGMGIDPRDPVQSSMAAAQMLRQELDKGASIEEAMTAHFGGPNREEWGPNTQRYMRMVTDKFQRLEGGAGTTGAISTAQTTAPAQEAGAGPFGTQVSEPPEQQSEFGRRLLEMAARDPQTFAQMFAGEGGLEQIAALIQGQQTEQTEQVRVLSGDTTAGKAVGLRPGERARVKGQVSQSGTFFPTEVVANPMEGGGRGGPLVNLFDLESGEVISRRRDDPEVDQLLQRGAVTVPDGAALETLNNMSKKDREVLKDAEISTRNYIDTVQDGIKMLQSQPDINTFVAKGAALVNDLRQEAKALGSTLGMEFDEDIFDVSVHEATFRQLGIDNQRMQSLITSLAFQRAAAEKGGQGRISNRDIERFIAEIGGGSSDPVSLAQTLVDTAQRAERAFKTNWEVRTGSPFTGSLGVENLPQVDPGAFDDRRSVPEGSVPTGRKTMDGQPVFRAPDGSLWVE